MASLKLRSLLKLNLKFLLDYEFLRDGRYTNVSSGQQYYDGSDMSLLLCDTSADNLFHGVDDGQVWQSPFRNWVYESGIVLNNDIGIRNKELPVICSGVYVDHIFRPTDITHPDYDSNYSHHIDWIKGRVIFNNSIDLDSTVQAVFAYKHVFVGFEHDFNNQLRESYLEQEYSTNPLTAGNIKYPSGNMIPFPAIFIELFDRRWEPYELGNRSLIAHDRIYFHVWSLDDITRDDMVDTLSYQDSKRLPIIDFNLAPLPLSGIYNEKSPEYLAYQEMLKNPRLTVPGTVYGTAHIIGYVSDIDDVETRNITPYDNFERSIVEMIVRTYTFHPNAPLGIMTGSYDFKGGTEYF